MIRGIWTTDDFAYEGRRFSARGQSANPKPAGPVPVWIGFEAGIRVGGYRPREVAGTDDAE